MSIPIQFNRRRWLNQMSALGAGGVLATQPTWSLAQRLTTPAQAMGPFYPKQLPLDQDNDLTRVQGRTGRAEGELLDVIGQVLDSSGAPLPNVKLEIWQVNGHGRYHHADDDQDKPWDPNFQGFGSAVTDTQGRYRFRTVRPIAYPGRAPHIHFAVGRGAGSPFFTQMYIAGAPENPGDFLLRRLKPEAQRSLIVALAQSPDRDSNWIGQFDIVLANSSPSN